MDNSTFKLNLKHFSDPFTVCPKVSTYFINKLLYEMAQGFLGPIVVPVYYLNYSMTKKIPWHCQRVAL